MPLPLAAEAAEFENAAYDFEDGVLSPCRCMQQTLSLNEGQLSITLGDFSLLGMSTFSISGEVSYTVTVLLLVNFTWLN